MPERPGESDDERRFREALNRHTSKMLQTLDAAVSLRTASSQVQRARHLARGDLLDFALKAMHAFSLSCAPPERRENNSAAQSPHQTP